jgi:hypothetical protein
LVDSAPRPGAVTGLLRPTGYTSCAIRRKLHIAIAVAAALAIAGCGSSAGSQPSQRSQGSQGSSASARRPAGIKFAACMRANGVPNFPDPNGGGGIQIPNGINPASPSFRDAQHACQSLMPGAPGAGGHATAQEKRAMLALSRCMRAHGIAHFPDPVNSPPASPAGMALAFGRPGAFIVVPQTLDPQSPRFKQAASACHFPGA